MITKVVTFINWAIIAYLGYVLIAEFINPSRGGDAAGRGIGQAILMVFTIVFVLMVILNLLPYNWSKYLALVVFTVPFLSIRYYTDINIALQNRRTKAHNEALWAAPIFEDKTYDKIARAIRDGNTPEVKRLLQETPSAATQGGELLGYAIGEASGSSYALEEKIGIVRMLFDMGASLESLKDDDVPIYYGAATNGNAQLLRLLFEKGADAKAVDPNSLKPLIFESIYGYMDAEGSVRAFLEYGADPNCTAEIDTEQGPITPLLAAAKFGNWNICIMLIEKGARTDFKAKNGDSIQEYVKNAESEGYANKPGFERLKALLGK